jgi:enoyl-CoA hydratase/carnithine racemase
LTTPLALLTGPDPDGIAVITLNRPEKKNALSIALRDEVLALLGGVSANRSVKALIITGSGGNFSAGFDLREFGITEPGHGQRLWESSDLFHHAVHRFQLPVIAAVDGIAMPAGSTSRSCATCASPRTARNSQPRAAAAGSPACPG